MTPEHGKRGLRPRQLAAAALALLIASGCAARAALPLDTPRDALVLLLVSLRIGAGPLPAWLYAASGRSGGEGGFWFGPSFWFILGSNVMCLVAGLFWLRRGTTGRLAFATLLWFCCGWYFTVGLWA